MKKLRVGLVGLGSISSRHVEAINKCSKMELSGLCARNVANLNKKANLWKVPKVYLDYKEMFMETEIDAVLIITPNKFHAPMVIAALNAGKHVFCEKPPALNASETKDMIKSANNNKKVLMYGFMFRFSRKYNFVKELIEKGILGKVYFVKAGILRRSGSPGGWFVNKEIS